MLVSDSSLIRSRLPALWLGAALSILLLPGCNSDSSADSEGRSTYYGYNLVNTGDEGFIFWFNGTAYCEPDESDEACIERATCCGFSSVHAGDSHLILSQPNIATNRLFLRWKVDSGKGHFQMIRGTGIDAGVYGADDFQIEQMFDMIEVADGDEGEGFYSF